MIENIIPGSYNLSASKSGFTTAKQSDITLVVNQTATFNLTLSPGVVTQVVNVTTQAAALEASTAELGVAVVKTEVNDLPLTHYASNPTPSEFGFAPQFFCEFQRP